MQLKFLTLGLISTAVFVNVVKGSVANVEDTHVHVEDVATDILREPDLQNVLKNARVHALDRIASKRSVYRREFELDENEPDEEEEDENELDENENEADENEPDENEPDESSVTALYRRTAKLSRRSDLVDKVKDLCEAGEITGEVCDEYL